MRAEGSKPTSTIETYGNNIHMNWSPDGKTIVVGTTKDRLLWVDAEEQRVVKRIDMDKEVRFRFLNFVCRTIR